MQRAELLNQYLKENGLTREQLVDRVTNGYSETTEVKFGDLMGRMTTIYKPGPNGLVIVRQVDIVHPDGSVKRTETGRNWTTGETGTRQVTIDADGKAEVTGANGSSDLFGPPGASGSSGSSGSEKPGSSAPTG